MRRHIAVRLENRELPGGSAGGQNILFDLLLRLRDNLRRYGKLGMA
jgi:hypothetical protein